MDEQVAGLDGGEDVGRLVLVQRARGAPGTTGVHVTALELRPVELGELPQAGEVEHAADLERLVAR